MNRTPRTINCRCVDAVFHLQTLTCYLCLYLLCLANSRSFDGVIIPSHKHHDIIECKLKKMDLIVDIRTIVANIKLMP